MNIPTNNQSKYIDEIVQCLEDWDDIYDVDIVRFAINRFLNKRGKCIINVSTILNLIQYD